MQQRNSFFHLVSMLWQAYGAIVPVFVGNKRKPLLCIKLKDKITGINLAIINTMYYICKYKLKHITMAQATLSMRVDDNLKKNFDMICDDFGFTSTAAITVFMKTVVRERRIPFEIKASSKEQINKEAWAAFLEMRDQAAAAGAQDMNLKEINAEILEARNER